MSSVEGSTHLKWDVFMTPGIPTVTSDMPPGVKEAYFQAMASTLIYGMRDAVLVDAFMTVKQANALADWVAASGKNLTTIYITHGHGDHWFGIGTVLERFPNARAVATPLHIMRNMILLKQNRFNQFLNSIEDLNTKTLTIRLHQLEEYGLVERKLIPGKPGIQSIPPPRKVWLYNES